MNIGDAWMTGEYLQKYHIHLLRSYTFGQAIAFGYPWRKDTRLIELCLTSQRYFFKATGENTVG